MTKRYHLALAFDADGFWIETFGSWDLSDVKVEMAEWRGIKGTTIRCKSFDHIPTQAEIVEEANR